MMHAPVTLAEDQVVGPKNGNFNAKYIPIDGGHLPLTNMDHS